MAIRIFDELIGKIFTKVEATDYELLFENDIEICKFFHEQDCCESVSIDDIVGDLKDLENAPIIMAEEIISDTDKAKEEYDDSFTWTFYKFATVKGSVTVKWYGSSNGYYSESVDFERKEKQIS